MKFKELPTLDLLKFNKVTCKTLRVVKVNITNNINMIKKYNNYKIKTENYKKNLIL